MPEMYCPQCGRALELDSGEIRFCRYCGFSLADTKEALHGYAEHKRIGFSVVTWAYALLLVVTLLLHGRYVSLDTGWVYWLLTTLIVLSVSFFVSAALSALKPAMFSKAKRRDPVAPALQRDSLSTQSGFDTEPTPLLPHAKEPFSDLISRQERGNEVKEPRSVIEGTTKNLDERSNKR